MSIDVPENEALAFTAHVSQALSDPLSAHKRYIQVSFSAADEWAEVQILSGSGTWRRYGSRYTSTGSADTKVWPISGLAQGFRVERSGSGVTGEHDWYDSRTLSGGPS